MNNPISGVSYLLDGFQLITKPGIKRFVIMPLLINTALFICLFLVLRHYMQTFNEWFATLLPHWLAWLSYFLWLFFILGFFLVFIYTFVTLANLIAAPFNSLLSEKVAAYLTGTLPPDSGWITSLKSVPASFARQFSVIFYYLPRVLLLFLLLFIPIIHTIAPIIWFLFNAWFMTITYVDYPADNHKMSFQRMRFWLEERRWVSLGFGVMVLFCTMVPLLNFFTLPAAVAGATKFWLKEK